MANINAIAEAVAARIATVDDAGQSLRAAFISRDYNAMINAMKTGDELRAWLIQATGIRTTSSSTRRALVEITWTLMHIAQINAGDPVQSRVDFEARVEAVRLAFAAQPELAMTEADGRVTDITPTGGTPWGMQVLRMEDAQFYNIDSHVADCVLTPRVIEDLPPA
ncbi:MAG: hypothetical protein J4F41_00215 [Alphaproteobacteria bacterium]|nr:hypothetical protein [Alphaproteobacteria bacterium]